MSADIVILRALDAAATQGPWAHHEEQPKAFVAESAPHLSLLGLDIDDTAVVWHKADAALIVAMRNELPGILDELEAYRALGPIAAGPNVMDGAGGPVCGCGAPSVDESGWCGREHLDAELESLRAWCKERFDLDQVHGAEQGKMVAELERLRRLEAAVDILARLADSAEHSLTEHDCDHHGHEGDRAAIAAARRIVAQARAARAKETTDG